MPFQLFQTTYCHAVNCCFFRVKCISGKIFKKYSKVFYLYKCIFLDIKPLLIESNIILIILFNELVTLII